MDPGGRIWRGQAVETAATPAKSPFGDSIQLVKAGIVIFVPGNSGAGRGTDAIEGFGRPGWGSK